MGYKPGMSLGLHNTGITAPLEESTHKGRRGLGFDLDGLEKEDVQWELEEVWNTTCIVDTPWFILFIQLVCVLLLVSFMYHYFR